MKCDAQTASIRGDVRSIRVACSECSLGKLCLPRGLDRGETRRFEQLVERSNPMQAGESLFRSGDPFRTIASVRAGCFKSFTTNEKGDVQVLGFHLPGEIIGLDAIHTERHVADCVALDTSSVCTLNFDSVAGMARDMPNLQGELFRVLSRKIEELEMVCGDYPADQRFALFLKSMSGRFSRRGYSATEFTLAMPRRDMANYLRLATETVSRILKRMQDNGVIEVDRKRFCILDMDALESLAAGD